MDMVRLSPTHTRVRSVPTMTKKHAASGGSVRIVSSQSSRSTWDGVGQGSGCVPCAYAIGRATTFEPRPFNQRGVGC